MFYSYNPQLDPTQSQREFFEDSIDPGSTQEVREQSSTKKVGPIEQEMQELYEKERRKKLCEGLNLQSFVLLIALSTHAIFEGIALGLTKELAASMNIMFALVIHKTAASMSLGISITKNF